jgi:hypothetical protein
MNKRSADTYTEPKTRKMKLSGRCLTEDDVLDEMQEKENMKEQK